MMKKKPNQEKSKADDKFATQEHPVVIFQPLSSAQIFVGNLEEKDEDKTEPFLNLEKQ